MVYSGRFTSYCLAAAICLLCLPAFAFAEQHDAVRATASVSDRGAENVSTGINPDYALPDYPALRKWEPAVRVFIIQRARAGGELPASSALQSRSRRRPRSIIAQIADEFSARPKRHVAVPVGTW